MKRLIINPERAKVGDSVQYNWTKITISAIDTREWSSNILVLQLTDSTIQAIVSKSE